MKLRFLLILGKKKQCCRRGNYMTNVIILLT